MYVRSVTQSFPTLCDLLDGSPPGSSVHGTFQARILEWVAASYPRGSSRPKDRTHVCLSPPWAGTFISSATWEAPDSIIYTYNVTHIYDIVNQYSDTI